MVVPRLRYQIGENQVERIKFDTILLNNASRVGVNVRQGYRALAVLRNGTRITGVRYADEHGRERQATARYVVDASGHGSRLHHQVGGEWDTHRSSVTSPCSDTSTAATACPNPTLGRGGRTGTAHVRERPWRFSRWPPLGDR